MAPTKQVEDTELVALNMDEINRWIGVPFGGRQIKEPFTVGDFRRWVTHSENFNALHWDERWAAESRFGQIVAPQSFTGIRDIGEGSYWICKDPIGAYHSADEYFFYGSRIQAGDTLWIDRVLTGARPTRTRYGPSVFLTIDITHSNQRRPIVRKRTTTMIHPLANMKKLGDNKIVAGTGMPLEEPEWSDEQLVDIEDQQLAYAKALRTHDKRLFGSVKVGDKLPRLVLGPHSGATIAHGEACGLDDAWGQVEVLPDQPAIIPKGSDVNMDRPNRRPPAPDLLTYVPKARARSQMHEGKGGHIYNSAAQHRGMPRAFAIGSMISNWSVDYLSNWAGEWGFLRHSTIRFNLPVLSGDITNIDGVVESLTPGPAGFGTVRVAYTFDNQDGLRLCMGIGDIELPIE